MEIQRDVKIEPEKNREFAHTTFPTPAPAMPSFTDEELAQGLDDDWRKRVARLIHRVEANLNEARRTRREQRS
jgi:hypothetical protein